ncbi:hypothetical protein HRI_001669300 [Hibiscus trionum]|uniref:Uncharacterized protein n=1 Tax=Hibiscus trionum TaxID=183268 RepID=A0A9W7LYW6_HIBTR|nr:hypothetical protein HRI_001669300 [Hibiscus trionum]
MAAKPNFKQPKRISATKAQSRQERGLCYYCNAKYVPRHKCKDPQFFYWMRKEMVKRGPSKKERRSFSRNQWPRNNPWFPSMLWSGVTRPTLRFRGQVHGWEVHVLIDGESTHNFIQTRVARHLGMPIIVATIFGVLVGNDEHLQSEGCIQVLKVTVQGTELVTDFYALPLKGTEIVLCVAWMATLGPVTMDFMGSAFEFAMGETKHHWTGKSGWGHNQYSASPWGG